MARALVDLHLHTTSSDGRSTPFELVEQAASAGLTVMAVTDHDTTASVEEVRTLAAARDIEAIAGIEITSVDDGRDVHVLGYFLRPDDPALATFLAGQRQARVARVRVIAARLSELGVPVDLTPAIGVVNQLGGRSIGRPQVARALVAAGHVSTMQEAFDQWLGRDRPAFVPRTGPTPEAVIGEIHRAGGLASLAHPGRTLIDARIPELAAAGLDALEVYHSDHDVPTTDRYGALAADLGLLATGGSDFHAEPSRGVSIGMTPLPPAAWQRLHAARHRHDV